MKSIFLKCLLWTLIAIAVLTLGYSIGVINFKIHDEQDDFIRHLLIQEEGYRIKPYTDTSGSVTIGIGHNLSANGLSIDIIEGLYKEDVDACIRDLKIYIPSYNSMNGPRKAVLVDLRFNTGLSGFLHFKKMLEYLSADNYDGAADEILNSNIAQSRKIVLAKIMRNGSY